MDKIKAGWLKKLDERVYIFSHSQACIHNTMEDGTRITVFDKIEELVSALLVQRVKTGKHSLDCNTYLSQGCWYISSGLAMLNMPSSVVNGWLKILPSTGTFIKQILYRAGTLDSTDYKIYTRTYNKTSKKWSDWVEIITSKTKVCVNASFLNDQISCVYGASTYPKNSTTRYTNADCFSSTKGAVGITINKTGTYHIGARATFSTLDSGVSSATGYRQVSLMKKPYGSVTWSSLTSTKPAIYGKEMSGSSVILGTSPIMRRLNKGDVITVRVIQKSKQNSMKCTSSYIDISYVGA